MTINRQHRTWKEYRDRHKRRWRKANLPCWLCGAALDYTTPGLPNSCEADHVTAVAAGGHVLGEIKPCCRKCNASRGSMNANDYRVKLAAQQHIDATRRPGDTANAIGRATRAARRPAPGAARPQPSNGTSAGIEKPVTTREWYKRTTD